MKLSQGFWQTFKEVPSDAEIPSHRLMMRAGLIQKTAAGLYTYMPFGLKVLHKVESIIRKELDKIGCYELQCPFVTPAELWQESGRWEKFGGEMLRGVDRGGRDICLSPTNEESFVDVFRKVVKSYKQLPVSLYQINTKFRDEIRPRYGIMRAREFLMKDAYSFHINKESLDDVYEDFFKAYSNILTTIGLDFTPVEADAGAMADGDAKTHEFQVIADTGEDILLFSKDSGYAANIEAASTKRPNLDFLKTTDEKKTIATPGKATIEEVCKFLNKPEYQSLKSLVYKVVKDEDESFVLAMTLGDDSLNEIKLKNTLSADHITAAKDSELTTLNLTKGFIGPNDIKVGITLLYDSAIDLDAAYVVGAGEVDKHFENFIPKRDSKDFECADLRLSKSGDLCPKGTKLLEKKGIEVGHIFQLGEKYTKAMNVSVTDENGKPVFPQMGCYGIGVSRVIASAIEQCHDEKGIIWPKSIAPYQVYFVVIAKSDETKLAAEKLYKELLDQDIEVILDDRKMGPGAKFKDADLLGTPLQLVLGERDFTASGELEFSIRKTGEKKKIPADQVVTTIKEWINQ